MSVAQSEFTAALLNPKLAVPAGLVDPSGGPAGKRFDVYRNNVVVSLLEAMETAFPVVRKITGPKFFRAMSGIYVRQHPPTSPLLMFYGANLPRFLESFEATAKLRYLPDTARLELARRAAYHAADTSPVAPDALAAIAPGALMQARISIAPASRILTSRYPIADIWHFNMTEDAPHPEPGAQTVLISRPALDPVMQVISGGTGIFLKSLQAGRPLSDAMDAAAETEPDFDLAAAIGLMMETEIITKIKP